MAVGPTSTTALAEVLMPAEADTSAPPPPPVAIHIDRRCAGSALVDTSRMPVTCEDATASGAARKLVQLLLAASPAPDTLLGRLGALRGDELPVSHRGATYNVKLPPLAKAADVGPALAALSTALGLCPNMFTMGTEARVGECTRCSDPPTPPPPKRKPPPPAEQEAATSTTPAEAPLAESPVSAAKPPTHEWSIEDVIQFIEEADPCLGVHADLFRKHVSVVDSYRFVLLTFV